MEIKKPQTLINRKGYIRLIEVSLAAALVFGFLIFVQQTQFSLTKSSQSYDPVVLKTLGEDSLSSLDFRDNDRNSLSDLRGYLIASNWQGLTSELATLFPENIGFSLYTINSSGDSTYRGGTTTGEQPTQRETVTVNYLVAGGNGTYCSSTWDPCNVKLALWFKT